MDLAVGFSQQGPASAVSATSQTPTVLAVRETKTFFTVLKTIQEFHDDGTIRNVLLYLDNGCPVLACSGLACQPGSTVNEEHLFDRTLIPRESYRPDYIPSFKKVTDEARAICYIKEPNLICYNSSRPKDIGEQMLREVKIYEELQHSPHDNIPIYLGCLVEEERIVGLCLEKYHESLASKVNPGHYNKWTFQLPEEFISHYKPWLAAIKAGMDYLHQKGYAHNDINPANIMFKPDQETPVIIDFDSCLPIGKDLMYIKRTYGWHDSSVKESSTTNDLNALQELEIWLGGGSHRDYRFPC